MAVKMSDICLYCGYPFGQGDHSGCIKRLKQLELTEKEDRRELRRQISFLQGRYARKPLKDCSRKRCKELHKWKGSKCHRHTREWKASYGE